MPADRGSRALRARELVLHLASRQLRATHRFTALGALWPLTRLLAQWAVLSFVFTSLVDLDIPDFPLFLLCGLVAWSWFASGVSAGTAAIVEQRHLVLQPSVPTSVLPVVTVAVALVDALIGLVVVAILVIAAGDLAPSALFLPVLVALQFVLMCGISWLTSAGSVYFRDLRGVVEVALVLGFYVTPVFYDERRVPEDLRIVLDVNPLAQLATAWRDVLIDGRLPDAGGLIVILGWAVALAGAGALVFRRLAPGFPDEL